jgi:hypothetical protein
LKAKKYLSYAIGIVSHPSKTVANLVGDPNNLRVGLFGVMTLGILYSISCFIGYLQGIQPSNSLLRLPLESYYLYEASFMLPVTLASWILGGTIIYFSLPRRGIKYEDVLGVLGLPYGILVLPFMWLPEIIVTIAFPHLWGSDPTWLMVEPVRVTLGSAWVYIGCSLAVKELYKLSWRRALLHTLIGLAVAGGFSAIFIR